MRGLMMDAPLLITGIMRCADRNFPEAEVVSITADTERHRYWYGEMLRRTRQIANALRRLDLRPGDKAGTLPHTATGKLARNELRRTCADYRLPETEDGS